MILVDTSAWVEYLRRSGSPANLRLRNALDGDESLGTTDVVVMELLAGSRSAADGHDLRRLLYGHCTFLPAHGPGDYEDAAGIYRACRKGGETIRSLIDCVIAAVAMRTDAAVLHADRDYEAISRHSTLRTLSLSP